MIKSNQKTYGKKKIARNKSFLKAPDTRVLFYLVDLHLFYGLTGLAVVGASLAILISECPERTVSV